MKKAFILAASFFAFAPMAFAAGNLGTVSKTVSIGQTLQVDLGASSTGRWFAPSLSNSNSKTAIVTTKGNSLIIQGLAAGSITAKACTEIQSINCVDISVQVTGTVLGIEVSVHSAGSWVLSGKTIYYVSTNGLIPVPTWKIFLSNGGQSKLVVDANESDLNLPLLPLMTLKDSRLN